MQIHLGYKLTISLEKNLVQERKKCTLYHVHLLIFYLKIKFIGLRLLG